MTFLDLDYIPPAHVNYILEDGRPSFIALSYTWGPPLYGLECEEAYSPAHDVQVTVFGTDGSQIQTSIGRNLYEAFLHIYETGECRPIWADALSINQSDADEKPAQVLLMGDIYSRARLVIVWLGVDDLDQPTFDDVLSLHGPDFLGILEAHVQANGEIDQKTIVFDPWEAVVTISSLNLRLPMKAMQSLYRFYARRRYLTRAWIIQEVVLSRAAFVLMNGQFIDFGKLSALVTLLGTTNLGGYAQMLVDNQSPNSAPALGEEFELITQMTAEIRNPSDGWLVDRLASIYGCHDARTYPLALMLRYSGCGPRRLASDPRDLIYSLLGVATFVFPSEAAPVRPHYTSGVDEVYTAFTTLLLNALPHRDVLSLVRKVDVQDGIALKLPSWVPDFRSTDIPLWVRTSDLSMDGEFPDFRAGFDSNQFSELCFCGSELSLYGRRCGAIKRTIAPFPANENAKDVVERAIPEWKTYIMILEACAQLGLAYHTGESITEAMFRVLCYSPLTEQRFRESLSNDLALLAGELYVIGAGNPEIMDLWNQFMALLVQLSRHRSVPTKDELERKCKFFALAARRGLSDNASKEAMIQAQTLFPELDIYRDGEGGPDLKGLLASAYRRLNVCVTEATLLFTTEDDYIGRVNRTTVRPGDELWLICQAREPFILRPTGEGKYILISEAFVLGAMYGELIENGVAAEPQQITIV